MATLRRVRVLAAVGVVAFGAAACGGGGEPAADNGGSGEPPAPNTVLLKFDTFVPSTLTVAPGDEVTWKWDRKVPHNIKGEGGIDKDVTDSGTYRLVFDEAGTYRYQCTVHPGMKGEITVR